MNTQQVIELTNKYCAKNYAPLSVVITKAEGVWLEDCEGKRYLDMLSSYSAVSHGHRHPRIINTLVEQAGKLTLTSRAFYNLELAKLCQKLSSLTGKDMIIPMNTGAEAVETAVKVARRWGYRTKSIEENQAEIIVCSGNFHGRTLTVISFSSEEKYKEDFGAFTPGFRIIPYGDLAALKSVINKNTVAFLIESIQGEAGIVIPPEGYLRNAYQLCKENNVLFLADEIQTGFGRTGMMFGCDWEDFRPDIYILGKALGGGVYPVSAVAANEDILGLLEPGSHGSTFGGNPLACAVACEAIDIIIEEKLAEKSQELGTYLIKELSTISSPIIKELRGKGLFIGMELNESARGYCEKLKAEGLLCKETHENVIRFAPPLVITKEELDIAIQIIKKVIV